MGYDKIRDKIFDLVQDHNEAFGVYKTFIRDGSKSSIKMGRKKMNSIEKKIEAHLKKIPPKYPYKAELVGLLSALRKDRVDFERKFQ